MQSQQVQAARRQPNVGPAERAASVAGGAALMLAALLKPSRVTFSLALGSGYLLYRGLSGNCLVYEALDIHRAGAGQGEAGVVVTRALTINRPVEEVYRFWRDFENLPAFMRHLEDVTVQPDDGQPKEQATRSHWVAKAPLDRRIEWDAEIVEERPNELISWRSLEGSQIENRGVVQFRPAPGGRGTELHVRLLYNPPAGSASAAVARLLGEEPKWQVQEDLRRFKEILEAGEIPTTQGQTSGRVDDVESQRQVIFDGRHKDEVQISSEHSFPASDSPGWSGSGV